MKKFLLLLSVVAVLIGKAQDTLVLNNNNKIISLVLLIEKDSIRYKPITDITGPDLYISTLDVQLVKYKSGAAVNVDSLYRAQHSIVPHLVNACAIQGTPQQLYNKGKADAEIYYPNKQGASIICGIACALTGPFGAVPAFAIAVFPPMEKNMGYPCGELWKNADYRRGYKKRARKLKRRLLASCISPCLLVSTIVWQGIRNQ